MKNKKLILLENRLRKLLKENTIKDPDDIVDVEVDSGVQLPKKVNNHTFDFYLDKDNGLENNATLHYNHTLRNDPNYTASTYDNGVIRYKNPSGVVMYFYGIQDSSNPEHPDIEKLMGNTPHTQLNNFKTQKQWNDFVKRIEEKKSNNPSSKRFDSSTKTIQEYIIANFPEYKDLLGPKPNDGLWGLKTDEAILKIIYDIKQKQNSSNADQNSNDASYVKSNVEKTQSSNDKKGETKSNQSSENNTEQPQQQTQYGLGNWY